jgi:xylulose-5-phosphate/fructose-6-phosphate phosphoketolase
MAATLDTVLDEIAAIQKKARGGTLVPCPQWPMIILRSPKGWTGPKEVDGLKIEGTWRAHQVPFGEMDKPEHVKLLEEWMRSYRPQQLFDGDGALRPEIAALAPEGDRRMSGEVSQGWDACSAPSSPITFAAGSPTCLADVTSFRALYSLLRSSW